MKKRSEFLRVRGGASWGTPAFLLQAKLREGATCAGSSEGPGAEDGDIANLRGPRFGFTVTKKMGNAVVRNRIRRRLKAAVGELGPFNALPECDYVLLARRGASSRVFKELLGDLVQAFERVHLQLQGKAKKRRR